MVIKLSSEGFDSFLEKHVLVVVEERNLACAYVLFYNLQTISTFFILLEFTNSFSVPEGWLLLRIGELPITLINSFAKMGAVRVES